jgi:hypothetical protein
MDREYIKSAADKAKDAITDGISLTYRALKLTNYLPG